MKTDTIAAIATAFSESGIGIIRISGDDAFQIADRIFLDKKDFEKWNRQRNINAGKIGFHKDFFLVNAKTHTLHYGYICLLYRSPSTRDRQKGRMPTSG